MLIITIVFLVLLIVQIFGLCTKTLFHSTILFTFFYRYRIAGVSVVSKGQDRLAGNI